MGSRSYSPQLSAPSSSTWGWSGCPASPSTWGGCIVPRRTGTTRLRSRSLASWANASASAATPRSATPRGTSEPSLWGGRCPGQTAVGWTHPSGASWPPGPPWASGAPRGKRRRRRPSKSRGWWPRAQTSGTASAWWASPGGRPAGPGRRPGGRPRARTTAPWRWPQGRGARRGTSCFRLAPTPRGSARSSGGSPSPCLRMCSSRARSGAGCCPSSAKSSPGKCGLSFPSRSGTL
mmetsp:Transcript_49284/g.157830  ORF Transcript_49284/g.157830 Transcript_49284/m.157830 type:complete len:235 (+) Transcript_49284:105-809(+)